MSLDAETVATLIRSSDEAFIFGSAIVVLTMQGGFALLESAVVQKKNLVDILLKNLVDSIVCGISFWLFGYGFAYGSSAGGVIGTDHFAMDGDDDEATELYNGINVLMHFFFQYTFVATTTTIVSGAIAERVAVIKYSVFSTLMAAFVYPVAVHWVWHADGFLADLGYVDLAGASVVHMLGGVAGLVGTLIVGPRRGRFRLRDKVDAALEAAASSSDEDDDEEDRKVRELMANLEKEKMHFLPRQDPTYILAVFVLWVAFFPFNCASVGSITGENAFLVGKVALNTCIAGCTASLVGMFARSLGARLVSELSSRGMLSSRSKRRSMVYMPTPNTTKVHPTVASSANGSITPTPSDRTAQRARRAVQSADSKKRRNANHLNMVDTVNGLLAGLVAVTAGAHVLHAWSVVVMSIIAAVLCLVTGELLERFRIDDVVGAFPVHGVSGLLGVLFTGLAHPDKGLFAGHGWHFLGVQSLGVAIIIAWTVVVSFACFKGIDMMFSLRISAEIEDMGLDAHLGVVKRNSLTRAEAAFIRGMIEREQSLSQIGSRSRSRSQRQLDLSDAEGSGDDGSPGKHQVRSMRSARSLRKMSMFSRSERRLDVPSKQRSHSLSINVPQHSRSHSHDSPRELVVSSPRELHVGTRPEPPSTDHPQSRERRPASSTFSSS